MRKSELTMTTTDPRPARTRQLLLDTLLQLVSEKRWDKIRVQDVLERSGVGRTTFYNHFDNKFDLLTAAIPDMAMTLTDDARLDAFFAHVEEMSPVLRPLLSQPVLGDVVDLFEHQLTEAWRARITLEAADLPTEDAATAARFLAGGLAAVVRDWFRTGCAEPAAVVRTRFGRMADATLVELRSR